jgi:hypothetical protein
VNLSHVIGACPPQHFACTAQTCRADSVNIVVFVLLVVAAGAVVYCASAAAVSRVGAAAQQGREPLSCLAAAGTDAAALGRGRNRLLQVRLN